MTCDCDSYNMPNGGRSEVPIDPPAWSGHDRPVLLDACIVGAVRAVWAAGYWTLGSCCGHNDQRPSLVLAESVDDYGGVRDVLRSVDARDWELLQWQLEEIAPEERTQTNE
jgi:hypothetical protein